MQKHYAAPWAACEDMVNNIGLAKPHIDCLSHWVRIAPKPLWLNEPQVANLVWWWTNICYVFFLTCGSMGRTLQMSIDQYFSLKSFDALTVAFV